MPAPDRIKQLVETFEKNINDYRFNKNETELRRQFLDPFFEALGWDVDNKQGKDERHKEVAHEFSVEIDGQQKKADYAFRTEKDSFDFLVEAKKPSVKVESNKDAAFQIRSYGWSAKLPINILTDFERFAIYDCRIRPNYDKDDAKTGRIALFDYKEYIERWDEIANLFSPNSIRNGALNEYSDGLKTKKGTQQVDDAFLEEIEGWREALAKNIAIRNKDKNLNEEQINFAVQMTIDRVIFLRIAEERGMEKDRKLFELIDNTNIYKDLLKFFAQADERYNSGLFHFKKEKERENPDTLSTQLNIDDKVLKDIIKDLYYPSPYAFTYIPTEILGSVYERFLGKVIRLTAGGNAKVEEKPEVRKAGGVYYTPSYIVEYIVKNTVGQLVEDKTPDEASKIKIVDPACGSGSFLLGAYQFLLDWHLDYYASNQTEKWVKNKTLLTADNKSFRLSIDEKKRILLNNIHGVDLDPQAVEVTKLSLLLKVVEDPGQLKMFEEGHILPNLNKNIKNGNALIGTDYFSGQMFGDMEEMKRVKPFDWNHEFPEVFKRGGFDAVIGNPPYDVMEKERGESSWPHTALVDYVSKTPEYQNALGGKLNLFRFFVVRSFTILKNKGRYGMIIPLSLLADISCAQTRQFLMKNSDDLDADCFPQKDNSSRRVFRDAKLSTCIITCTHKNMDLENAKINVRVYPWNRFEDSYRESVINLSDISLIDSVNTPIPLVDSAQWEICIKLYKNKNVKRLGDVTDFLATRGEINQTIYREYITENENHARLLKGVEVGQYKINQKLSQGKREWLDEKRFLSSNKEKPVVNKRRIATQRITGMDERLRIVAMIIEPTTYFADSTNSIALSKNTKYKLEYLLGLLNSTLFQWRFKLTSSNNNVATNELDSMPIRTINFNDPTEKSKHDKMVSLVEQMLALHKSLAEAKTPQEGELIKRQITSTDKAIDSLVYELYGLSQEEIEIVEK